MSAVLGKFTYYLPVFCRLSATLAADSVLWGMRCPPAQSTQSTQDKARKIRIRCLELHASNDVTVAVGSTGNFQLRRFFGSDLTTLTDLQPSIAKQVGTEPNSIVTNARVSDGSATLTGGISSADVFASLACPRSNGGSGHVSMGRPTGYGDASGGDDRWGIITLGPGEGIWIRNAILGVIGDTIAGYVAWEEGTL